MVLQMLMLVSALAYTFVFVVSGFGNKMDPYFWFSKFESMDTSLMTLGTVATGYVWLRIVGRTIFALRLLGWLCAVVAIALPYVCLLDGAQRRANLHWLTATYILMGYGVFQEFSPGALSMLLLSVLIVLWVKSLSTERYVWPIAIVAGLAVLVRLPNVLVLPLLGGAWAMIGWNRSYTCAHTARIIGVLLTVSGAVVMTGYGLWWWLGYQEMSTPQANHTIVKMLTGLWNNGWLLLVGMSVWGVIGWCIHSLRSVESPIMRWIGAICAGALLVYGMYFAIAPHQWYNTNLHYFVSSAVLALGSWLVADGLQRKRKRQVLIVSVSMMIMMIVPMGSDTAWLKLFPAVLCLLPWWAAAYWNREGVDKLWIPVLVAVSGMCACYYTTNSIGNCTTFGTKEWGRVDLLRLTRVGPLQNERMDKVVADYATYRKQGKVYMLGEDMHLFRALTHAEPPYKHEFWSNIYDPVYTKWYRELVEKEHPILFVSYTPTFMLHKDKDRYKESMLENMLREEGYREVDRSAQKYMIYLPK